VTVSGHNALEDIRVGISMVHVLLIYTESIRVTLVVQTFR